MTDTHENSQWSISYRPNTLDIYLGPDDLKKRVKSLIDRKNQHCILISGPTGCGKTTLANIIAGGINGYDDIGRPLDTIEQNMGTHGKIDDTRNLIEQSRFLPNSSSNKRILILEEAHKATGASAEALLRPLESPSKHCMWVLATNEPERLLPTLVGRTYPLKVDYPDPLELKKFLLSILKKEGVLTGTSPEKKKARSQLVTAVVKNAGGQPRLSLQLLQAAIDSLADYKTVKDLLTSPVMQDPHEELDKATVKIVLALCKTVETGNNNYKALVNAIHGQDGYSLTQRLIQIVEAVIYDSATGTPHPAAWNFKRLAKEHLKTLDLEVLSRVLEAAIKARTRVTDYSVPPRPVLLAALSELYWDLYYGAQEND